MNEEITQGIQPSMDAAPLPAEPHRTQWALRFIRRFPRVTASLFGVLLCMALLVGVETYCYAVNRHHAHLNIVSTTYTPADVFWREDSLYGSKLQQNSRVRYIGKAGAATAWKAIYSTDKYGRRLTPVENPAARDRFLAFFGCSFAFGEDVNDNETLPYYTGQLTKTYRPCNYGVPGWGPQHLLARLENEDLRSEIGQPTGIGIYILMDSHPARVAGSMRVFWGRGHPCYEYVGGQMCTRGSFQAVHPLRCLFYDWLLKEQTLIYLEMDIPPAITEYHLKLTSDILIESAKVFQQRFPGSTFYVLLYPGSKIYGPKILANLAQAGVASLDYHALLDGANWQTSFPDFHPVPRSYEAVARQLVADLALQ